MSAPNACVVEVQEMPLAPFWGLLRDFGGWANWFPLFDEMRIINTKEGVGAVRKYETITGSVYEEELVELNDAEHILRYDILSVKPAVPGVKSVKYTVKLEALAPKQTKITWSAWTEAPGLDPMTLAFTLGKVKAVQEQVFHAAIQSMLQKVYIGAYLQEGLKFFNVKTMSLARSLLAGKADIWEYADLPAELGPLPRIVKGLPASQAMSPQKIGAMVGRALEVGYLQIAQTLGGIGQKKEELVNHEKEYLSLVNYGHGQTQQEKDLAKRLTENWEDDVEFCQQLLQGANPMHIKMARNAQEVPIALAGLTITEKSGETKTIPQLVSEKRLFILDYRELANFELKDDKYFYPAVMLVYREILDEKNSRLNVLGIQLDPTKNEIFTPDMPQKNRYKLAKIFVASADGQFHEFYYHLGLSHFGVEAVAVAMHNRLPKASKKNPKVKTHPLRALLEPHYEDTIGINYLARLALVPQEYALTEKPFALGTEQAMKLTSLGWRKYDFFKSSFPEDLKARGFDEEKTDGLQNYFYREDGFKLWHLLGDYTTDAVNHIYADDDAVKADSDLQKWADEMAAKDGANYAGFPSSIGDKKLLAHVLQIIIWNASALHSLLNNSQWTYTGYIPNRPNAMYQPMPELGEDQADITEEYIKKSLGGKFGTLFQTVFPWLLSIPSETNLLDLAALKGIHDDVDANFQKNLQKLGEELKARNDELEAQGKAPYIFLMPGNISCSVDI